MLDVTVSVSFEKKPKERFPFDGQEPEPEYYELDGRFRIGLTDKKNFLIRVEERDSNLAITKAIKYVKDRCSNYSRIWTSGVEASNLMVTPTATILKPKENTYNKEKDVVNSIGYKENVESSTLTTLEGKTSVKPKKSTRIPKKPVC